MGSERILSATGEAFTDELETRSCLNWPETNMLDRHDVADIGKEYFESKKGRQSACSLRSTWEMPGSDLLDFVESVILTCLSDTLSSHTENFPVEAAETLTQAWLCREESSHSFMAKLALIQLPPMYPCLPDQGLEAYTIENLKREKDRLEATSLYELNVLNKLRTHHAALKKEQNENKEYLEEISRSIQNLKREIEEHQIAERKDFATHLSKIQSVPEPRQDDIVKFDCAADENARLILTRLHKRLEKEGSVDDHAV